MRPSAPLHLIPTALAKTGFLLEHAVAEEFRAAGWSVISNRYYVDDVDGRARELDMVVYRVKKIDDLEIVTSVLISCKKDASHTWAFLSKERPLFDPNMDWEPVHHWTDCEPLNTYLSSAEWRKDYITKNDEIYLEVFHVTRSVFAFQLVSADGTAPKNDSAIFDSITGLLKALDHEIGALPDRAKNRKRLYLFTLATIVDAPLVDVQYVSNVGTAIEVFRFNHVARFMVRRRELSAQVHFVRSDFTGKYVASMSALAEHNATFMAALVPTAYAAITTNVDVRRHFGKVLARRLIWRLNFSLREHGIEDKITNLMLSYDEGILEIGVDLDLEDANTLDSDSELHELVAGMLKDVARYTGRFSITSDIPF